MPRRAVHASLRLRWLVIARLESAGLSGPDIAKCTGYSERRIKTSLLDPAYQEWRNARLSNAVSAIDHIISNDDKEMKLSLRELVPAAIKALENALHSNKEEIQLRAASEILDRDQRFNKQQNIAVAHIHTFSQGDLDRARELAKQLKGKDESPIEHITLGLPNGDTIDVDQVEVAAHDVQQSQGSN
jgi:hypothetical protein